jgi:transposase-like protein
MRSLSVSAPGLRVSDGDAVVLSLNAKGFTTWEISAPFAEVVRRLPDKDTGSRITDQVLEEMQAWTSRALQPGVCRGVHRRPLRRTSSPTMKCLYMVTRSLDLKGTGQTRWAVRWKPAMNAFAFAFADRMPAAEDR